MDSEPEETIPKSTVGPILNGYYNATTNGYDKEITNFFYMTADIGDVKNLKNFSVNMHLNAYVNKNASSESSEESIDLNASIDEIDSIISPYYLYLNDNRHIILERSVSDIEDVGFITTRYALRNILKSRDNIYSSYYSAYLINGVIHLSQTGSSSFYLYKEKNRKYDDAVYIPKEECPNLHVQREKDAEKNILPMLWGLEFKKFMLSSTPNAPPNPSHEPHAKGLFFCTYDLKLNNHRLFYDACNDGMMPPEKHLELAKSDSNEVLVEKLKNASMMHLKMSAKRDDEDSFRRFNVPDIWNLGFLANIRTVFIGYRNFNGVVERVKKYSLPDLVDIAEDWSPLVSKDTCDLFLTTVKNTFVKAVKELQKDEKYKGDIRNLPPMYTVFSTMSRSLTFDIFEPLCNSFRIEAIWLHSKMTNQRLYDIVEDIITIEK